MRKILKITTAAILTSLAMSSANAQDIDKLSVRVLGDVASTLQSKELERPFFEKIIPEKSGGNISVQFRTMDESGIKGFEALRLLKTGVFDILAMQVGSVSADAPVLQGVDLPGTAPEIGDQREIAEAYRPVIEKFLDEHYNAKLLALWPYPGQTFFCRSEVTKLDDLAGLKTRVYSAPLSAIVTSLGGAPVQLSFIEVYQALQRGVADCAVTGTLPGNTAKWFEVATHLYPLYVGWSMQMHVAPKSFWDKLSPASQEFLATEFQSFEDANWTAAEKYTRDGVNCNTGTGTCQFGTPEKMHLAEVTDDDRKRLVEIANQVVVPQWFKDCDEKISTCSADWKETIGKVIGFKD